MPGIMVFRLAMPLLLTAMVRGALRRTTLSAGPGTMAATDASAGKGTAVLSPLRPRRSAARG